MKPWLLLDVSYLAYRAFHAFKGNLSHDDIPTTVLFGVVRDIFSLQQLFETEKIAFCFDVGKPHRKTDFVGYKAKRDENKTAAELAAKAAVQEQITSLRKEYLPRLGFRNILWQKRYEADDIIANVVMERPKKHFVIVSSDEDLFQLLSKRVSIYNPTKKELLTLEMFQERYRVPVEQWADVKAMAGCASDNIPGIRGIGEKTAIDFLTGRLKVGKKFNTIVTNNSEWRKFLNLTTLPYPCCDGFKLVSDEVTNEKWLDLFEELGMDSLIKHIPGAPRRSTGMSRATLGIFDKPRKK